MKNPKKEVACQHPTAPVLHLPPVTDSGAQLGASSRPSRMAGDSGDTGDRSARPRRPWHRVLTQQKAPGTAGILGTRLLRLPAWVCCVRGWALARAACRDAARQGGSPKLSLGAELEEGFTPTWRILTCTQITAAAQTKVGNITVTQHALTLPGFVETELTLGSMNHGPVPTSGGLGKGRNPANVGLACFWRKPFIPHPLASERHFLFFFLFFFCFNFRTVPALCVGDVTLRTATRRSPSHRWHLQAGHCWQLPLPTQRPSAVNEYVSCSVTFGEDTAALAEDKRTINSCPL